MKKSKTPSKIKKFILIPLAIVLIAIVAGTGYTVWNKTVQAASPTQTASIKTTSVRRGTLTISATGTGTLVAGETTNLAFPTSGKVGTLNVSVGSQVKKGDVLAALADTTSLEASVTSAKVSVNDAQKALDDLNSNAAVTLANAEIAVVDAQKAYDDAKSDLKTSGVARCDSDTTEAKYSVYLRAQAYLESLGDGGGNQDYYLNILVPAKNNVTTAYAAYMYCAGYTTYEINSSKATLALTDAELKQAQDKLDTLKKNNGVDPDDLAQAENTLANAKLNLSKAEENLNDASLVAPYDGTITAVNGEAGDEVDTDTFITIADLHHPKIQFAIDETDMDKVAVGYTAQITFDAIPDKTYTGKVVLVNPNLESVSGYQVLRGYIEMDLSNETETKAFVSGLNAGVEIIAGEAKDALLVPVEAIRELDTDEYGVFVVGSDGTPRLQVVTVGLMDATYAEIKSGLQMGDVVSTGTSETY
jgi:RND family efflux transporter MFP subunit